MLEIVSHKIAQTDAFVTVDPNNMPPAKRWCAVCNTALIGIGYLDKEGYAGAGAGAVLCQDHAFAASQSASQPQMENEMLDPGYGGDALATEAG